MPPNIALTIVLALILFLFIIEAKGRDYVSRALWLPLIWMLAIGSRSVHQWIGYGTTSAKIAYESGSPIDRYLFFILIIAAILVLFRRKIIWSELARLNTAIMLLILYGGISVLWSDFPFVSLKRWTKGIGTYMLVLIVLTESNPTQALKTIMKRSAYLLIPLSIVLIKYYPHLGRSYGPWTGVVEYIGVTNSKNMLGQLCLVYGLFFIWNLLSLWRKENILEDKIKLCTNIVMLLMVCWLCITASSATSIMSLIVGGCILIGLFTVRKAPKYIGTYIFVGCLLFLVLEVSLDASSIIISKIGREMTMSGRTDLWKELIGSIEVNTLTGTGYESFWLGTRLEKIWANHWWKPNQAHNGYIEIYLNLGIIGLSLLSGVIISSYKKIRKRLLAYSDYAKLQMTFFIIFLIYNVTEASFKEVSLMWFLFLCFSIEVPRGFFPRDGGEESGKSVNRRLQTFG